MFLSLVARSASRHYEKAIVRYIQPGRHIDSYVWHCYSGMEELNLLIRSRDCIIQQKNFLNPALQEQLRVLGIYLLCSPSFAVVIMLSI